MAEHNIRIKKCKNCGKYFVLKGGYSTDYCDRIPDGEKFTRKKLVAAKARKKKVQDNPILKYEKAYRRMYAHLLNHKTSSEDFRLWTEAAANRRDSSPAEHSSSPSDDIINQFKECLDNERVNIRHTPSAARLSSFPQYYNFKIIGVKLV